jgi:hypothetical protein
MASLTSDAKKKFFIWSNQYKIGENKMSSSVALLKIIIRLFAAKLEYYDQRKFTP